MVANTIMTVFINATHLHPHHHCYSSRCLLNNLPGVCHFIGPQFHTFLLACLPADLSLSAEGGGNRVGW